MGDRFLRPEATVLPDSALVPEANLVHPPRHFTHTLQAAQPYHYAPPAVGAAGDGTFEAGARLQLVSHPGGPWCVVVDGRGLRVVTAFSGLQALP